MLVDVDEHKPTTKTNVGAQQESAFHVRENGLVHFVPVILIRTARARPSF